MRFRMIDRILELEPRSRIVAEKGLRADEDYLRDHFPQFPVMPGVLMLEAMFQAAMWLVRKSENFAHSLVVLKEARNIRYADFVEPGQVLRLTAEIVKSDERTVTLKAEGQVNGKVAVSGRLILERFNQADTDPRLAAVDARTRFLMREKLDQLCQGLAGP